MEDAIKKVSSDFDKKVIMKKYHHQSQKKKVIYLEFIEEFAKYLKEKNYAESCLQLNKQRVTKFCKDLETISNFHLKVLEDCELIDKKALFDYEKFLLKRITSKEISEYSAYCYLKNIRLFIEFLFYKKIVPFKYSIPKSFIVKPPRSNSYIDVSNIDTLVNSIISSESDIKYRNIVVLIILLETGCRALELSNVKLSDLNLIERTMIFESVKSGKRKLVLSDLAIKAIKKYLEYRKEINPNTQYFIVKQNGDPGDSKYISSILTLESKKAFGKPFVNPKSLRHTFVTNAFENNNDPTIISETIGHKHWVSTFYYLHRSKSRLLNNTLQYNPLSEIFLKEDTDTDANSNKK